MPSSSRPYQSKILRFVLQQWQQGIDRQDRAWRQLQSNATWGAKVAMFPIYAMLRAVERANFALGGSRRSNSQSADAQMTPSHADSLSAAADSTTDIDRSIATILAHTETLLSSKQKEQLNLTPAEDHPRELAPSKRSWIATLWARLWPQQQHNDQALDQTSALAKSSSQPGQLITSHPGALTSQPTDASAGELAPSPGGNMSRRAAPGLLQNGHTLASMIENRHLVVVRTGNEIADIFTLDQQRELKSYIFKVITAYWQGLAGATRIPRRLSAKTLLAFGTVSLTALPMELRKAWAQLPSSPQPVSLPPVGPSSVPRSRIFLPRSLSAAAPSSRDNRYQLPSRAPHAFETDVHATRYLEHPLEKILRWLDRILSWCERLWQKLMDGRAKMK